jgi:hypothetical protein
MIEFSISIIAAFCAGYLVGRAEGDSIEHDETETQIGRPL